MDSALGVLCRRRGHEAHATKRGGTTENAEHTEGEVFGFVCTPTNDERIG